MQHTTLVFFLIGTALMAEGPRDQPSGSYLALGDSLPFGYNPLIQPPDLSKYGGYPVYVSGVFSTALANASCPGETSGTFDGTSNRYYPGFDCAALRARQQLFVNYGGAQSQLDYAAQYLVSHRDTKLVTVNIGGNDLALVQYDCFVAHPNDSGAQAQCGIANLPAAMGNLAQNLVQIFTRLRATGYAGPIVAVNYFPFNYNDPLQLAGFSALNSTIAAASAPFGVKIADTFSAFKIASRRTNGDLCAGGFLLKLPDGTCDTHPSAAGQMVIAGAVSFVGLR